HNNLGAELAEAGQSGEAVSHFETALRANPADAKTRENLVHALRRQGMESARAGRWPEAIPIFQRTVQLTPGSAAFQAALAVALVNANRLEEAVPVFQTA